MLVDRSWEAGQKFRRVDGERVLVQLNSEKSIHNNKFKPWSFLACAALSEKQFAEKADKYLKGRSGRAFAKRHLEAQSDNPRWKPIFGPALSAQGWATRPGAVDANGGFFS